MARCTIQTPHWCNEHRQTPMSLCRRPKPGADGVTCTRFADHDGDHACIGFGISDRDEWPAETNLDTRSAR